jgi:hypothetical protein
MPEGHPSRIVVTVLVWGAAVGAAACGGSAPEPVEPPPQPAPFVLQRPPEPATTAPRPNPAPPPAPVATPPATALAPSAAEEPSTRCALSGRVTFPPNTPIQNAEGRPIARLSGAETSVSVSGITLAASPRARIETGTGRGGLRLRGFVEARQVPAYTQQRIPVFAGHIFIGEHRSVAIVGATADGKLKLEKVAAAPLQQTFTAWSSCAALTLTPGTPPGWAPAGDARGYVLKKSALELFDAPNGSAVGVLHKAPATSGVLWFSTEQAPGWVRVELHGEIIATGWARAAELSALPRGETLDQLAPPSTQRSPAALAVPGAPRSVRVTKEVPVRSAAKETDLPIALIEPDAEVYVLDIMAGWASVLPKTLTILPPEGGHFWAKKTDLGL